MVGAVARQGGFSVVEILVALALITVAVLALLGVSLYSMSAGRKSRDLTAGLMIAEQALERLAYEADSTPGAAIWTADSQTTAYQQQVVTMSPSVFNVTIYVSDVAPATFGPNQRLKQVESLVVWQDTPQGKANQGILRVRTARLLHEP